MKTRREVEGVVGEIDATDRERLRGRACERSRTKVFDNAFDNRAASIPVCVPNIYVVGHQSRGLDNENQTGKHRHH
jgi:hypothetical protein